VWQVAQELDEKLGRERSPNLQRDIKRRPENR
jgi:hypothetical protein